MQNQRENSVWLKFNTESGASHTGHREEPGRVLDFVLREESKGNLKGKDGDLLAPTSPASPSRTWSKSGSERWQ